MSADGSPGWDTDDSPVPLRAGAFPTLELCSDPLDIMDIDDLGRSPPWWGRAWASLPWYLVVGSRAAEMYGGSAWTVAPSG